MARRTGTPLLLALGLACGAWAGTAEAASAFMDTRGRTTQPVGHFEFCQREPAECRQKSGPGEPTNLTRKLWAEMIDINNAVNVMVTPRTDLEMWGREEIWSYPTSIGDCEDYALEKRRRLMAAGIPGRDLLLTVVRQPNGDGHAVLTVRTSRGDFILDNLEPRVLVWSATQYTYLKRQSERNSGAWVAIDDSRGAVAVGSVR